MTFGFPAMLGGGAVRAAGVAREAGRRASGSTSCGRALPRQQFPTVAAALTQWQADGRPNATITILDSRTYVLPAGITLSSLRRLSIEAANGERPHLQTRVAAGFEIDADAVPPPDPALRGGLTLCGLLVEGFLHVVGDVGRLRLLHSTIVPGRGLKEDGTGRSSEPSIVVEPGTASARLNARLRMEIAYSVCGPIECPDHARGHLAAGLDRRRPGRRGDRGARERAFGATAHRARHAPRRGQGAPARRERVDLHGSGRHRPHAGGMRALQLRAPRIANPASVPLPARPRDQARAPRGARGRPGLTPAEKDAIRAFVAGWLVPAFATTAYGRPAYCQLSPSCPLEIRTGAEDGSEMGAYCHLKQPQRESNLRIRLDEYLPFGLDAGLIYVT